MFLLLTSLSCNIASLVIKGYHECKYYGPSYKGLVVSTPKKSNLILLKGYPPILHHLYKRSTLALNGKFEKTPTPKILRPLHCLREYEINKEKDYTKYF